MGNMSSRQLLQPAAEEYITEIAGNLVMQRLKERAKAGQRPTLSEAEVPLLAAYLRGCYSSATAPSLADLEERIRSGQMMVEGRRIVIG